MCARTLPCACEEIGGRVLRTHIYKIVLVHFTRLTKRISQDAYITRDGIRYFNVETGVVYQAHMKSLKQLIYVVNVTIQRHWSVGF